MKIGILGTRGIPNYYGGFEQFAQVLSQGLADRGEEVWVYNSHNHPWKEKKWKDVHIIHCYDPEDRMGIAGQFIYDLNCIRDSRRRNFDLILQLGYTSSSIWHRLLPSRKSIIVTNMDGLEWKRSKYSPWVRRFLKYAEKLAVKSSHHLIADSPAIQKYLAQTYDVQPTYLAYGADIFDAPNPAILQNYQVRPFEYYLLIARMQTDNHVEEIIQGVLAAKVSYPLLVVGNAQNKFGRYLQKKYANPRKVIFTQGIFESNILNQLRYHCRLYFHGHSAGGTNPSLLEAMAASAFICAHRNPFNEAVLQNNALYFTTPQDITRQIDPLPACREQYIAHNLKRIRDSFSWESIVSTCHDFFINLHNKKSVPKQHRSS